MGRRKASGLRAHQGWSIDSTHPSRPIINVDTIFDHLANLYHSEEAESATKKSWVRDVESFVQAHTDQVLGSPLFIRAPISAVQRVVSLPSLNVSEDYVLQRVLQYAADAANVLSASPAFWTNEEREVILPILVQLFPYVRTFSLSTEEFLRTVEPMKVLNTAELIDKYRFDAFARQLSGEGAKSGGGTGGTTGGGGGGTGGCDGHTLASIRRCYKDPEVCFGILQHRLRGLVAVSESPHPYYEGTDQEVEEVRVAAWTPRVLVEFDRRSCVGLGGQLTFYKDRDATEVLGTWHDMWPRGRRSVKSFVVDSHKFYVGFRSCLFDRATWGWKMFVTPLPPVRDVGRAAMGCS